MDPEHKCHVCPKRYKRRDHLQRHMSSHVSDRPYRCTSCASAFRRPDVLKRHLRTCNGKARLPKVSARRSACDRCVRQKKACSSGRPCQNCSAKVVECNYSASAKAPTDTGEKDTEAGADTGSMLLQGKDIPLALQEVQSQNLMDSTVGSFFGPDQFDESNPSWDEFMALTAESLALYELGLPELDAPYPLRFLDCFTSKTGFVDSFDCGTLEQRERVVTSTELDSEFNNYPQSLSSISTLDELHQEIVAPSALLNTPAAMEAQHSWLYDSLSLQTHQILLLVKEVVTVKPRNSAVKLDWSPALENACLRFFAPANIRKYLGLFWAAWHPNVNFVHRPTFDPRSTKPVTLATMVLIGACVSPDMPDNEDGRIWFDCVEEMAFIDEDFNSDTASMQPCHITRHRRKIEAIQAAYMVCLYQNWEGSDASKSRVRRHRFASLVSAARDIDITTARHTNYAELSRDEFDWADFAAKEQLIRIFIWIFLLDTAFVIFNNIPPRMVTREMAMHMAVPEACFQAMTPGECYEQIKMFLPKESMYWKMTFRHAFECLCKGNPKADVQHSLADLGPLNLFTLASAIHPLIFQYRNSFGAPQLLLPIRSALTNWREIWQLFTTAASLPLSPHITVNKDNMQPQAMWKRLGFCRFCPEYWLLASLMADRLEAANCSMEEDVEAPSELERLDDGRLDPILDKYDQTSMRQVNDLIAGFQRVQI